MYSLILPSGNAQVRSSIRMGNGKIWSDHGGGSFLSDLISLQQVFVDQIFRIFDKDGNGSIDFKVILEKLPSAVMDFQNLTRKQTFRADAQEFMLATDMTASGSPEEKLRWAFKMYDKVGKLVYSYICQIR